MKLTEILVVLGFIVALATFILTRFEKRKKLTLHLKFDYLKNIDTNFSEDKKITDEERLITIEIINDSNLLILVDTDSLEIKCNNNSVKNFYDLVGKDKFKNPLKPGDKYQFGIFVEEIVGAADIPDRF